MSQLNSLYAAFPMEQSKNQIRILTIGQALHFDAPLDCRLTVLSLDDDSPFDALSWCWGSSSDSVNIAVDGHTVCCSSELGGALRHLRLNDAPRRLWVDFLCINQTDLVEKSWQIILMRRVYQQADCVRIWLGKSSEDSDVGMRVLEKLLEVRSWCKFELDGAAITTPQLRALVAILHRPWWERTWTTQEAALAKYSTFHCGRSICSTTGLPEMLSDLTNELTSGALDAFFTDTGKVLTQVLQSVDMFSALKDVIPIAEITKMVKEGQESALRSPLLTLLEMSGLKATDPRDKIYGAYGLLPDFGRLFVPDYSLPVEAVYTIATICLIIHSACLNPLCYVIPNDHPALPSWALDFSRNITKSTLWNDFSAIGDWGLRKDFVHRVQYPHLTVRARFFDEITAVYPVAANITVGMHVADIEIAPILHAQWRKFFDLELDEPSFATYIAGGTLDDAYWYTAVCGICPRDRDFSKRRRITKNDIHTYLSWLGNTQSESLPFENQTPAIEYSMGLSLTMMDTTPCFFKTKKGYIGLSIGRGEVQVRDHLYLMHRARVPFAMTPQAEESGRKVFQLRSECYVHGIMDGEALGPSTPRESLTWRRHDLRRRVFGGQELDENLPVGDWSEIRLC